MLFSPSPAASDSIRVVAAVLYSHGVEHVDIAVGREVAHRDIPTGGDCERLIELALAQAECELLHEHVLVVVDAAAGVDLLHDWRVDTTCDHCRALDPALGIVARYLAAVAPRWEGGAE